MSEITKSPGTMADDAGISLIDSFFDLSNVAASTIYSGRPYQGQSFTNTNSVILSSASSYLKKQGSPTGSMYAKIYAHTGTYGTSSLPTGEALATSDAFDVSILTTSFATISFTFSGVNQIALSASTYYVLELYYAGGDANNFCLVGQMGAGSSASGNCNLGTATPTFTAYSAYDNLFYIYSTVGTVAWSNPDNAKVSDNVYATFSVSDLVCFVAGTQILTPQGGKSIESLKVGDVLYSFDTLDNNKVFENTIIEFLVRETDEYYAIIAENIVKVTGEHLFLTDNGFVSVENLKIGDTLITINGLKKITSIKKITEHVKVYNYRVGKKSSTYIAEGFFTHNYGGA